MQHLLVSKNGTERERDLLSYISNHRVMHAQSLDLLIRKLKIHLKMDAGYLPS